MTNQIKLLWIDDNLDDDLMEKRMALLMQDDIEPHFAHDATEAYYRLRNEEFDVVIFDLRLPPGPDDMWEVYRANDFKKFGYALLHEVSSKRDSGPFHHLGKTRFGVFTLETRIENAELFEDPIRLPAENFKMKIHALSEFDFLDFIRNIFKSKSWT
jgi:CheY-like chemotaxis protein